MKRFWVGRTSLSRWAVLLWLGCGGRTELDADDPRGSEVAEMDCVAGRQVECACLGGGTGVQRCRSDGSFGACACGGVAAGEAPSFGAGSSGVAPVGNGGRSGGVGSGGGEAMGSGGGLPLDSTGGTGGTGGGTSPDSTAGYGGQHPYLDPNGGSGGVDPFPEEAGGSGGTGGATIEPEPELPPATFGTRPGKLINAFPATGGILVVEADAVVKLDRDGAQLERIDSEREITAAAFEQGRLVVADRALFTVYDEDLGVLASGQLVESCASAVMVSGARFVCGPSNDWDRIFYTYDTSTGQRLASSLPYTYNGIPMRRVPGSDDFVTVSTDSSPSDFHLYSVLTSGQAVFVSESPYHGDFSVNDVYAFYGSPTNFLVTSGGLLLEIYVAGCNAGETSGYGTCFVRNGELGTLTGGESFVGMDSDANGFLYGLVLLSAPYYYDTGPATFALQRIDVVNRRRLSEKQYTFNTGVVRAARHDATSESMLVGVSPSPYYYPTPPNTYELLLLPYE